MWIVHPRRQRANIVGGDGVAVLEAQQILQQHALGDGQAADAGAKCFFGGGEAEDAIVGVAGLQRLPRVKAVERGDLHDAFPDACNENFRILR